MDDIALTVGADETLCLVGESGSGKTVAAQAVMGLLPKGQLAIDAGRVELLGEDLTRATPGRLRALRGSRMAMIFQEPMTALNPVMRIGPPESRKCCRPTPPCALAPAPRARMRSWLPSNCRSRSALGAMYPHQLSGGQRPARDDRHGARARTRVAHRRRADHRAGRHHPGAHPRPREAPPARTRHGRVVHHP